MTTTDHDQSDRDLWAEPLLDSGIFTYSFLMSGYREDFSAGLRAFAAAWFATYEDETNLPAWFATAIKDAEDIGLDPLTIPGQEVEDDDEVEDVEDDEDEDDES